MNPRPVVIRVGGSPIPGRRNVCHTGRMSDYKTGGFIHGEDARLIGEAGGIDYVIPRRAWNRGHEALRLFDGAALQAQTPTLPGLQDFVTPLLRQMIDRQVEQRASLPPAPEGYEWAIVTEWPQFDVDHTTEYKVTWRWVLRAADGSDQ